MGFERIYGSKSATTDPDYVRKKFDYYPTPPFAVFALKAKLRDMGIEIPHSLLEPAAGRGHMAQELMRLRHEVEARDIFEHPNPLVEIKAPMDFLEATGYYDGIITNPPYLRGLAEKFVHKSLDISRFVAMLTRSHFAESRGRYDRLFSRPGLRPSFELTFSGRFSCSEDYFDDPIGGMVPFSWYVWDLRGTGSAMNPCIKEWINTWDQYEAWKDSL